MMFTVAEDDPPLLLAQIVNVLSVIKEVGVPQIVPLLVPNDKPLGRMVGASGEIAHEVIVPEPDGDRRIERQVVLSKRR